MSPYDNPNALTLEQCIAMRDSWFAAVTALATGIQEYTVTNGSSMRKVVRTDIKEAEKQLRFWDMRVRALTPGARCRVRRYVPGG